ENCTELAPYLCETDYVTASFGKSKLIRKSTLAEGASCCDFWYVNK
ncbi:L-2-amino-thiazoline-4-carboxylic acid hydrolase, partial [Vallitalea guaymasensis]